MRHTARALIIRDKKLLLVSGHGEDRFWTPGGGVEGDEPVLDTLHRELFEELGVKTLTATHYMSYTIEARKKKADVFIVETSDDFIPSGEITHIFWYTKDNFTRSDTPVSYDVGRHILPRLIKDGLL